MSSDSPLERLARAAGVLTSYDDVFGTAHAAEPATLRRVLAALGYAVDDDARIDAEARACEDAVWRRPLEPVYVVDAGDPRAHVGVALRADAGDATLAWALVAEDGAAVRGDGRAATLPLLARGTGTNAAYERRALVLPRALAPGYYRLELRGAADASASVVLAPPACHLPDDARGAWGLAVQLYALRSRRNWGIGDFTDLARLCTIVARAGGAAVGLNPLHEVRFAPDGVPSPYSPSSRAFANWIYLDVESLPGYDAADVDATRLGAVRASVEVDYAGVAALKRETARRAFARFRASRGPDLACFDAFVDAGGDALRRDAIFGALVERFAETAHGGDWAAWPAPFRDPASPEVAAFARERDEDVAFFAYLQWQADEQLARASRAARLPIGLYRDLAVGADTAGADTWSLQGPLTRALAAGAPPDLLNTSGQNWGVAPFDPRRVREAAYAPFIALLRANMRHAGALRIDHVMALARLWLVPAGASARDGAYVAYRLDELLGIVALESVRARCIVVGEDLGTVPAGFRERLASKGVLSYRLLQFETDDDGFLPPAAYPELALVATGTHDLPPIGAYWTASDVGVRARLGLIADEAAEARERDERSASRARLLTAFDAELGADDARDARFRRAAAAADPDVDVLAEIALAANRYLARTPSRLLMVQLEDVLGDVAQINVPTTRDEHPNWRRRASIDLDDLASDARFVALAAALRESRGAGQGRSSSPNVPSL